MVPGWGWRSWMECDLHLPCVLTPPKGSGELPPAHRVPAAGPQSRLLADLPLPGAAASVPPSQSPRC